MAHLMRNSDKDYPCVRCGQAGNIIREGADPRLKCNACNMLYDASQSIAAEEAGAIPDGPPPVPPEELTSHDVPDTREDSVREDVREADTRDVRSTGKLPRTLVYVVVSKDRTRHEFCNKKELKRVIFSWETDGVNYEVFELTPKAVQAKVDIQ